MGEVRSGRAYLIERGAIALIVLGALGMAGCQTAQVDNLVVMDAAQGSAENISSLSAVIDRNPRDPEAYNVRGSAYGRAGQYDRALDDFNKAIQLRPGFYQAYANRALIHRFKGDDQNAVADYNKALQINPSYDAAYIGRGTVYRLAGRADQAFQDFNRAIQLNTTDPRAYHNRGLLYQSRGQQDFAIEDFATAISLAPDSPEPYNGRGISYLALNHQENALADFNRAIQLDKRNAVIRGLGVGLCPAHAGRDSAKCKQRLIQRDVGLQGIVLIEFERREFASFRIGEKYFALLNSALVAYAAVNLRQGVRPRFVQLAARLEFLDARFLLGQ